MPSALVVLSSGIGNCVRWTPLIRALHELQYKVDVMLDDVDYPETIELLRGAPEIRTLTMSMIPGLKYDVAIVARYAHVCDDDLPAAKILRYPRELWKQHGDNIAAQMHARALGYEQRLMPHPFVMTSAREFPLAQDTICLHAGCKAGWNWKRWPYFDVLAAYFASVVVVGTAEDEIPVSWPSHVQNYVGTLSLVDTAALIRSCVAFVGNDSGLAHVAAALDVETFPIFGITRPAREAMPLPNVHAITNRSACHESCIALPHNARTCVRQLACLKSLTPREVLERMRSVFTLERGATIRGLTPNMPDGAEIHETADD